jgi:hypothetical protein
MNLVFFVRSFSRPETKNIKKPRLIRYQIPVIRVTTDQKDVSKFSPTIPEMNKEIRYKSKNKLMYDFEIWKLVFFLKRATAHSIPKIVVSNTRLTTRVDVPPNKKDWKLMNGKKPKYT